MASTILSIGGMTCGGCVSSVTKALNAEAGVHTVAVDLAAGVARIEFDPAITTAQHLADAVIDIGFEASCPAC